MQTPIAPVSILGGSSESRRAATPFLNRLVWLGMLLLLASFCLPAHAQTGEWVWMGGSASICQPGVYGTLGTPDPGNNPGGRAFVSTWTDSGGNLWLFGGEEGFAWNIANSLLNDLWKFNPSTNEWTWMGGSSTSNQPGVYGTLGTPAPGNIPGSRYRAATWIDGSGNFWLFGGSGFDSVGNEGYLSDLWKFNPSTNEWTWISGSSTANQPGVYGTLETPAAGNVPGARNKASTWIDGSGNLWLLGGVGIDSAGNVTPGVKLVGLNDLWEFNPSSSEWAWMGGSSTWAICGRNFCGRPGVYGTLGTPAAGNIPEGRVNSSSWTDSNGNFWLFGGEGETEWLNDLWEFNPSTNEWTWMNGSATPWQVAGVYGTLGTPAPGNTPGGRASSSSWTDSNGHFWLFGGYYYYYFNDLWEFDPSTNEWAWMAGNSALDQVGVYGTLGVPAVENDPGYRDGVANWTDSNGNLWLFGGVTWGAWGMVNDLWEFLPSGTPPPAATPTISEPSGTYTSWQTVSITDTTPGAFVYYTLDGTAPTIGSARYSTALTISQTTTVKAIAWAYGYTSGSAASATYTLNLPSAATPVFTPAAGTYTSIQSVQISSTTPGAAIYYTLDGSTPTTGSARYSTALTIGQTATVKAIAVAYDYAKSAQSATYTINLPVAAAPVFTPPAGAYTSIQSVQISSVTPGAVIYYTLDGSTPNTSSATYSTALTVSKMTTVINAISVAYNYNNSAIAGALYTIRPAAPTFSLPSGEYLTPQSVTISNTFAGATIYYTTDGSAPSRNATPYTGAITIDKNMTIRATAVLSGYFGSPYASAAYGIRAPTPTFSLAGGEYLTPQSLTISAPGATIYYTTDGSSPTAGSTPYTGAIPINKNVRIRATAVIPGNANSQYAGAAYAIKAPAPTFSLPSGIYPAAQQVTISDSMTGAAIYYTTDGTTPTSSSTPYTGSITVSSKEKIIAIATATGYANSPLVAAAYGIK
ncbi:MAG TPA: chitobiase/beta-hexosaminidase C-terminal domain-containing protein [Terracidiphilus sp.]|jgi:N-acetylneuraminic acid mutarotase|nr:chitobiase/beta-hexosaminidase C-terminal domain-containing protein [Terracidiphilus sp.]